MSEPLLYCREVRKVYREAADAIEVLHGVDLAVAAGEIVAITGASGSGKTTLLQLLAGLDAPTSGEVRFLGRNWQQLSETERCFLRNRHLGFIFQFHHLLPEFSALENVLIPLQLAGIRRAEAEARARAMLAAVGLEDRLKHAPYELSGGERQRVAVARALVHRPRCLLADEPTGNLDPARAREVWALCTQLVRKQGAAALLVTHDPQLAASADRVLRLEAGMLISVSGK